MASRVVFVKLSVIALLFVLWLFILHCNMSQVSRMFSSIWVILLFSGVTKWVYTFHMWWEVILSQEYESLIHLVYCPLLCFLSRTMRPTWQLTSQPSRNWTLSVMRLLNYKGNSLFLQHIGAHYDGDTDGDKRESKDGLYLFRVSTHWLSHVDHPVWWMITYVSQFFDCSVHQMLSNKRICIFTVRPSICESILGKGL